MMVAFERIVNSAETTLNGGITSGATTLIVASAGAFPSEGVFRIIIDSELMIVTSVSGTTFTVTRGAESTLAASHSNGVGIAAVVTRDSLNRIVSERTNNFAPSRPPYRIADASGNLLTKSDFTVKDTDATMTLTDGPGGSIVMSQIALGATIKIAQILRTAPTAPYIITGAFRVSHMSDDVTNDEGGIFGPVFRDSVNNTTINYRWRPYDDSKNDVWRANRNVGDITPTVTGLGLFKRYDIKSSAIHWFQMEDDNTDIFFRYSSDGVHFIELFTEVRDNSLVNPPDQIGLAVDSVSIFGASVHLLAWQE